jgi:hypothetical protein
MLDTDRDSPLNISLAGVSLQPSVYGHGINIEGVPYVFKLYIYPIKSCKGISVQQAKIRKQVFDMIGNM